MLRSVAALLAGAFILAGCATTTMENYMGRTVQEVAVTYGPPTNVFDMPDGRRAFQWQIDTSFNAPARSTTYGTAQVYAPPGSSYGTVNAQSTTVTTPATTSTISCLYTMYGKWDEERQAWILVGFEKPRFICN